METDEQKCPVEVILKMVTGKWKIMIFRELVSGKTVRFNQLLREIPNVSAKVLRQQLRELEDDGIIQRKIYEEIPPRVEYSFTESGLGILKAMMQLQKWGYGLPNVDMSKCMDCKAFPYTDD
jgi:DNA-binding HxlR family transcriptional regulator